MNTSTACALLSMAAGVFHFHSWAAMVGGNVAIQDLTPNLHIYLKVPTLHEFPNNLETAEVDVPSTAIPNSSVAVEAQTLIDEIQVVITGEELMFAMEVPYVPGQEISIVLAQAASTSASVKPDFVLNSCRETEHTLDGSVSPFGVINPDGMLRHYLASVGLETKLEDIKITLLSAPMHGKLNGYFYTPTPGYLGNDRATFMADYKGKHYKIVVTIKVLLGVDENSPTCPDPILIKVNNKAVSDASPYYLNSFTVTFGDLMGGSVGQTTGEGASAQITLDTTAAGHGWYIDPTPLDNTDDYLPTSNPNIWQAKAGTDAAGKMDMLSVLLHEYGHALGLEHSDDSGDFMAATLQPGQRRLPSADELTLMSQLVAQLKASTTVADGSAPINSNPGAPGTPSAPLNPSAPLGALLIGRLALGRRPEDEGTGLVGSQALFSANATLQGGNLSTLQDWATQGSVVASPANTGSASTPAGATLAESTTSQTRLNQVFMVGPKDRYLSFTLSNLALDDATAGPDDAFEAALINANTGANLLGQSGGIGLSQSDALLNLQAAGGGAGGSTGGLAELAAQAADDSFVDTPIAITLVATSVYSTVTEWQLAFNTQSPRRQRVQPHKGSTHPPISEAYHGSFRI